MYAWYFRHKYLKYNDAISPLRPPRPQSLGVGSRAYEPWLKAGSFWSVECCHFGKERKSIHVLPASVSGRDDWLQPNNILRIIVLCRPVHLLRSISRKQQIDTASIRTHHKMGKTSGFHDDQCCLNASGIVLGCSCKSSRFDFYFLYLHSRVRQQRSRIIPEVRLWSVLVPADHYESDNKQHVYIVLCGELTIIHLFSLLNIGETNCHRQETAQPGHSGQKSKRVGWAFIWRCSDRPPLLLAPSLVPLPCSSSLPEQPLILQTRRQPVSCLLSWRREPSQGTRRMERSAWRRNTKKKAKVWDASQACQLQETNIPSGHWDPHGSDLARWLRRDELATAAYYLCYYQILCWAEHKKVLKLNTADTWSGFCVTTQLKEHIWYRHSK